VEGTAFQAGRLADVPLMVVQSDGAVGETLLTDGIEGTTDGLAEARATATESLLQGAEATVGNGLAGVEVADVVVVGEDAVLTADDAGDEVAVTVGVGHALTVDDGLCRGREVGPYGIERVFYLANLVERHRGTGIAFNTTGTLAGTQVATELLSEDVGRDEYLADLQDRGKFLVHIKLSKFPLRGLGKNKIKPQKHKKTYLL